MELTRREMLKMSLLGSAALFIPLERRARTVTIADRLPESRIPAPFQTGFSVPPVLRPVGQTETTDYYEIAQVAKKVEIVPGLGTEIYGYNGMTPGPTIVARQGRQAVVRQINRLPETTTAGGLTYETTTSTHLHGSASLPQYDGYADDVTAPGEYKDYVYPNIQDARTLWYHDHGVHHTAQNAYMGLAGFYILHDAVEDGLPIPKGDYDVPLVIRDAIVARSGDLIYDDQNHSSLMGDIILANGKPWPVMQVEPRKYRFRVLNASISRGYDLALSTGDSFHVIGTDGGLMPEPAEVESMRLGMAERYEVVIDFARYAGKRVVLQNRSLPNNVDYAQTGVIMRFDVGTSVSDYSNNEVPDLLNPGAHPLNPMKLRESDADPARTQRLVLERQNGLWMINGTTWDKDVVNFKADHNETQIWELTNESGGWFHPLHIHLVDFKILDRRNAETGAVREPYPWEKGPKDVAYIGEGETVRVIAKFGPHKGRYMIHCHNLTHEDHDMMNQFQVGEGGDPWSSVPARPISEMGPLVPDDDDEGGGDNRPNAAPVISALSPSQGSVIPNRAPTIKAVVRDRESALSEKNIRMWLDGRRVFAFSYDPATKRLSYRRRLAPGRHTVKVVATDAHGRSTLKTWGFRITR